MNVAKASPLTAPAPRAPLSLTPEEYQSKIGSLLTGVDRLEGMIRSMIEEEKKQERISELGGRIYDIAVPAGKGKPESHPLFEKIMKMRGEMMRVDKEEREQKSTAKFIAEDIERYDADDEDEMISGFSVILNDEPVLLSYVEQALEEGKGHYGNKLDTHSFVKDMYKQLSSHYGKKEIKLTKDTAYSLDRFDLEPDEVSDEPDYDTEYKKDKKGNSYAHITKVESKTYDILRTVPYKIVETITYEWDVDTYTDEYGDEVADDEDIGYENADVKTSYKLVRK